MCIEKFKFYQKVYYGKGFLKLRIEYEKDGKGYSEILDASETSKLLFGKDFSEPVSNGLYFTDGTLRKRLGEIFSRYEDYSKFKEAIKGRMENGGGTDEIYISLEQPTQAFPKVIAKKRISIQKSESCQTQKTLDHSSS